MKRLISICIAVLVFASCMVSGCGVNDEASSSDGYKIYYTDQSKTKLVTENYHTDETDTKVLIEELIYEMTYGLDNVEYSKAVPEAVSVLWTHYDSEMSTVSISFSSNYYELSAAEDIMCRAAVVRTLAQIEKVDYVLFLVDNNNLKDSAGNDISRMSTSMFVDVTDTDSLKRMNITLYFTDKTGKKLIECDREVVVSSTVSSERLVISQLIEGPVEEGLYPTLSDDLNIISINLSDGICYVNFDSKHINSSLNVSNEISVYSIVNTLTELSTVNKVQILVDGKTVSDLGFTEPLERNLDYVGILEEE